MPLRIRPLETRDVDALARALAPLRIFREYGLDARLLAERWTQALAHEELRVAEEAGELLGLARFLTSGTFGSGAYLRTLAVVPTAQGKGVGKALLETYELEVGDPPGGYFLLASDFNEEAHAFYASRGYREVGRLPSFARPGIEERIFWKPRSPAPGAPPPNSSKDAA